MMKYIIKLMKAINAMTIPVPQLNFISSYLRLITSWCKKVDCCSLNKLTATIHFNNEFVFIAIQIALIDFNKQRAFSKALLWYHKFIFGRNQFDNTFIFFYFKTHITIIFCGFIDEFVGKHIANNFVVFVLILLNWKSQYSGFNIIS